MRCIELAMIGDSLLALIITSTSGCKPHMLCAGCVQAFAEGDNRKQVLQSENQGAKHNLCSMARILALDYGLKRTGIAVTDPLQMIASGLTTVETRDLLSWLKTYCASEPVERFVIGLPLSRDGRSTDMSAAIEAFAVRLQEAFPEVPVTMQEEKYSSRDATKVLIAAGVRKKQRQVKGMTDKVAAAIILQAYMQQEVWK